MTARQPQPRKVSARQLGGAQDRARQAANTATARLAPKAVPNRDAYWRQRGYAGPGPQRAPSGFTTGELMNEIKYLMALNRRYGQNELRTAAYMRLMQVVQQREQGARQARTRRRSL